ncbi:unnamed protein product [Rotaria sp. Silwood1]|nr:unnamed protein product [Rotaria sp. Silwood1]CAF1389763.1 unnamed protein product [Rotaria sp. Silwood1]CAF3609682.1 unnamed protein product [Rotaria sp. Silwood1]CAF3640566.1 unnamed protein product [Rotaria sp. Silwood1]CAF4718025.1 unnamed protein product [Rotaria sp. Silwood1]
MSIVNSSVGDWRLLLSDKVVFVTGGAGWLARHIAKTCYDHGARLVLADMNIDTITKVKNETFGLENTDDRILTVQLDVQNEETIKKAIELTLNKWNTINVVINTAAIFTLGFVEDVSADDWSHIMNVNVRGYALMVKHIAPILKKQNSGSIINFASAAGLVAHSSFLPYSTSKAAIIQMTRNLALDLGSFNIRVNSISPGAIESPTIYRTAAETGVTKEQFDEQHAGKCIKRLGHVQEVANMTVFLSSDLCSFMTGTNIVIDGGYTIV